MSSINDIKADENYVAYRRILSVAANKISLDGLMEEARVMHNSRPARNLYKVKLEPTAVFEAAAKDVNVRSRLVEIRAQIFRQRQVMARATTKLRDYLSTTYTSAIRSQASTQHDRRVLLDRIMAKGIGLIDEFDTTLELLDGYIKDIDQTGFAIRNVTEVLKLLMAPNKSGVSEV